MYNLNQMYATPVKRFNLNDGSNNQQSNQQEIKYRTHQHLHKNNYFHAVNDTPSTLHTTKTANFINRNADQVGIPLRPCLKEGIISTDQKHARNNSKILSIREIKQQKARIHSRVASQNSVNSTTKRKLFVTISKANCDLSHPKGVLLNSQQTIKDLEQKSRRIKLTKYLQLRSVQKAVLQ